MHAYKDGILNSMSSSILYPGTQLNYFHKEDMTSIICYPFFKPGEQRTLQGITKIYLVHYTYLN